MLRSVLPTAWLSVCRASRSACTVVLAASNVVENPTLVFGSWLALTAAA